ncbi:MAG: CoA ester lyase [Rhodospirillales bacterium]
MTDKNTNGADMPFVWRSLLYVPANNEKFVAKAHTRGADAIILDLEDSVPESERPRARDMLADAAKSVAQSGADVAVRINRPIRHMVKDVEAAVHAGAQCLFVTKVDGAGHLKLVAELVEEVEREAGRLHGSVKLAAMVETADAYFRAHAIGRASSRLVGMNLGGEDFAVEMGMVPDTDTLLVPKQTVMIAAKAAGLMAMGFIGTVADYNDTEGFRAAVRKSVKFGFDCASVIHPSGIPVLNEEFTPAADAVDHARRVIDAYAEAQKAGKGAITIDGKMIDVPIVIRAERLLARSEAIKARGNR